jgi:hypothetical protein
MVYHLIQPIATMNQPLRAKNDIVGSMVVIALMLGCVIVMRLLLTQS